MEQAQALDDMWAHHGNGSMLKIWSVQCENDIKVIKNNTMLEGRVKELEWYVGTALWGENSAGSSAAWKETKAGNYIQAFGKRSLVGSQT